MSRKTPQNTQTGLPKGAHRSSKRFKKQGQQNKRKYYDLLIFFYYPSSPQPFGASGLQNTSEIEPTGHLGHRPPQVTPTSPPRTLPRMVWGSILHVFGKELKDFWTWGWNCCEKSLLAFTFGDSLPQCSAAVRAQHMELAILAPQLFWTVTFLPS